MAKIKPMAGSLGQQLLGRMEAWVAAAWRAVLERWHARCMQAFDGMAALPASE